MTRQTLTGSVWTCPCRGRDRGEKSQLAVLGSFAPPDARGPEEKPPRGRNACAASCFYPTDAPRTDLGGSRLRVRRDSPLRLSETRRCELLLKSPAP
jgi:hypothetical protein